MGTRADFYVGNGKEAKWIGSIAWDGYPDAIANDVLNAKSDAAFVDALGAFLSARNDATFPENGWPWPWNDSATTDFAYAFFAGGVKASCFGGFWFDPGHSATIKDDEEREQYEENGIGIKPDFPDMSSVASLTLGNRSGLIIIGG
jgi:hypothetical protein